ncbi:MAG: hypothetical protein M1815_003098 [Lichina confinis]|nr:MAG: hypothetical protein M1815_003098 [Lichina confinis]
MAEAVAVFATAGGALQVADVALRWGGKIYEFLSAVRQAPQEVQSLRKGKAAKRAVCKGAAIADESVVKAVDDVNSVIRDLNRYIAEFNMSASARAEHNVLPEVVIRAVQGFRDDLASIKELLPIESPLRLGQKIRWGLDKKRKLKEATEKLESRKTTVLLALEIDGR